MGPRPLSGPRWPKRPAAAKLPADQSDRQVGWLAPGGSPSPQFWPLVTTPAETLVSGPDRPRPSPEESDHKLQNGGDHVTCRLCLSDN